MLAIKGGSSIGSGRRLRAGYGTVPFMITFETAVYHFIEFPPLGCITRCPPVCGGSLIRNFILRVPSQVFVLQMYPGCGARRMQLAWFFYLWFLHNESLYRFGAERLTGASLCFAFQFSYCCSSVGGLVRRPDISSA